MDLQLADYAKTGGEWPIYVRHDDIERARLAGLPTRVFPEHTSIPTALAERPGRLSRSEGYVGIPMSGGEVELDANIRLTTTEWRGSYDELGVVDRIVREDPVGAAIRMAWTLPLLSVPWNIVPASEDPKDVEVADFIEAALFEHLSGGFEQWLEQAVQFTWRGWALFEIVAKYDKALDRTVIDRLSPRLPWTIDEWRRHKDGRWGAKQYAYSGDGYIDGGTPPSSYTPILHPDKLLHLTYQPDGDNPEPMGILRPCYGAWRQRRTYLKLEATGFERACYGIPFVEVDVGASPGDVEQVNIILRELRSGIRSFAMFPRGYTLQFAEFPMKAAEIREARVAAGHDMARAALCQFLFTGAEIHGSFALVRGQLDHYTMALQQAANRIAASLSQGPKALIKRLVSWNFEGVDRFPTLEAGEVRIGNPRELVEAIKTAVDAGALFPDSLVESKVRSVLALPAKQETARDEDIGAQAPGPANGAEAKAADTALNGAQVSSALSIVQSAASGEITRESAIGMISNFFNLPREVAEEILGGQASPKTAPPPAVDEEIKAKGRPSGGDSERGEEQEKQEQEGRDLRANESSSGRKRRRVPRNFPQDRIFGDSIVEGPKGRGVRPIETVVRFSETRGATTAGGEDLGAVISEWRLRVALDYAAEVAKAKSLPDAMMVTPPDTDGLLRQLREGLQGAYESGQQSVKNELERQREDPDLREALESGDAYRTDAGVEPDDGFMGLSDQSCGGCQLELALAVEKPRSAPGMGSSPANVAPEPIIDGVAESTVLHEQMRMQQAAGTALQAGGIAGTLPATPALRSAAVLAAVQSLSTGEEFIQASKDYKTIFGLGRIQEQRAEGIKRYMYSNLTESETCEVCAALDGHTFGEDELNTYATPYSECLGQDNCNCLVIGIVGE